MSALGTISIKQNDGTYKKYTVGINDTTNQYGNNIEVYEEQTKEERESKAKKKYLASGRIFWTNGSVKLAEKKDSNVDRKQQSIVDKSDNDDLPFNIY